ncbi:MAG: universal stress protein [Thermodesulfovibrionales bacterium]|nr:universal stress protein [Thermodesulfovibrionales bacterium]
MNILVPVDGSKCSLEGLKVARDYAKTKDANIYLINVTPYIEFVDLEISASEREKLTQSMEKRSDDIVNQACKMLSAQDVIATCKTVTASVSVPDAIIDFAEKEKINLIIIGSRGLGTSKKFRLGSIAAKVVRHSHCGVYVVKEPC